MASDYSYLELYYEKTYVFGINGFFKKKENCDAIETTITYFSQNR